ncbi:hypothetical protein GQ57_04750 [Burkholderia sp. MSh2]|uniref:Lipoprotein n=1 Tax=Burkholderia paludis TaxID=1506587 RepID=A0A6P2SCM9_9BURK|nr:MULTISPECIES: hypothetical protein [Burkholderia]KEZ07073.1 hypothetical protein GQ57_04750 [Burkholderia sp. MSh2]CAB3748346.1 hypothetical protein LMG30113_00642 [Burkholderia paludis]VWC46822.1 hypothetical protein BPA30113_07377 [Burkholderia paludis]
MKTATRLAVLLAITFVEVAVNVQQVPTPTDRAIVARVGETIDEWIYAGSTADGKPILTQATAQVNSDLQAFIVANANSAAPGQVGSAVLQALKQERKQ